MCAYMSTLSARCTATQTRALTGHGWWLPPSLPLHPSACRHRAFLRTDLSTPAFPDWNDVESAPEDDASFTTFTSTCGCTPDNPTGGPTGLVVQQTFSQIELRWAPAHLPVAQSG